MTPNQFDQFIDEVAADRGTGILRILPVDLHQSPVDLPVDSTHARLTLDIACFDLVGERKRDRATRRRETGME